MSPQILRISIVQERTGLARSTIYANVANGSFPKPISLGGRAVGWLADEVTEWITLQVDKSRETSNECSDEE